MARLITAPILLLFFISRFTAVAFAEETNFKEQIIHYDLEFQNVKWYQKIAMFFYGVNWDELSIRIKYQEQPKNKIKIVSINAWPASPEDFHPEKIMLSLENTTDGKSFIQFLKYTEFRPEEAQNLIELFNFIYDSEQNGEKTIKTDNLFEKEDGSMYGTFQKTEKDGKSMVCVTTYNSSGTKNGYVEITLNSQPELHMEKIVGQLKIGITIVATELAKKEEED
ncbi:MAG: hypothetical protein HYY86_02865 [Candidatus Harrisonbacteria bacterium]|nr:hypothetical protein [Candidatus Harrisonbacteria bacterium]